MVNHKFSVTDVMVPLIGQGTWDIGSHVSKVSEEIKAVQTGLDLGMTHIDTAEMYGSGRAEKLIGRAIARRRQEVFLVSKVLPSNASYQGTLRACENSLNRLGTDYLDLYLLHWWSNTQPIEGTMTAMEELVRTGKIRFIGVSNLTIDEIKKAQQALTTEKIVCNQVCYHLRSRGIEFNLLLYCQNAEIALVGYSPFGQGDFPSSSSRQGRALAMIGAKYGKSARQVALRFLVRKNGLFAIPKAGCEGHVRENSASLGWDFSDDDLEVIDKFFPSPYQQEQLDVV